MGRGTWRGVDCGARCGAGRASQIAGEGAAPLLTAPPARTGGARGAGRDKCVAHGGSRQVDRSRQLRSHLRLSHVIRHLSHHCALDENGLIHVTDMDVAVIRVLKLHRHVEVEI